MRLRRPTFTGLFANILGFCAIGAVIGGIVISYLFFDFAQVSNPNFWSDPQTLALLASF